MLNRKELQWDEDLLKHLELATEALPKLAPYSEPNTGLCPEFAERWPSLSDVPFFLAVGDGAAVNVGTGCTTPERIALSVGTSSAMRVLTDQSNPEIPAGLWAYRLGREHTLMGGAFSEGGLLVEWAKDVLKLPERDQLDSELEKREPDSHGLTVLPFLAGERATGWTTNATGVFDGIRTSTTALDIVQAMMEAVSLRFALVADLLAPERQKSETVFIASGGAVRSSAWWARTMADAINSPVAITVEKEGTSRGAAVLALVALGLINSFSDVETEVRDIYDPDPGRVEALKAAAKRQQALYDRILG